MTQNSTEQSTNSPLSQANPASLDELFSRDPLGLGEQDIALIVTRLREQRKNWLQAESQGATKAPKAKKAPKAPADGKAVVSLDDLGL